MTERERLIELLNNSLTGSIGLSSVLSTSIADYLLANGAIVPPCNIGDTVYYITAWDKYADQREHEQEVIEITKNKKGIFLLLTNHIKLNIRDYGKWWYTDKEQWLKAKKIYRQAQRQAEKALKARGKE